MIKPYRTNSKHGRPPIGVEQILRMYLLQIWFNLSEPATEDALYGSYAMQLYLKIPAIWM